MAGFLPDTPEMREMMVKYYGESHADQLFGRIAYCGQRGLRGNTMVVFMGDNGRPSRLAK
jgi:arylsulfatase A-like enzyme